MALSSSGKGWGAGLAAWHSLAAATNMPIKPSVNVFLMSKHQLRKTEELLQPRESLGCGGRAACGLLVAIADDNISSQCVSELLGPLQEIIRLMCY